MKVELFIFFMLHGILFGFIPNRIKNSQDISEYALMDTLDLKPPSFYRSR